MSPRWLMKASSVLVVWLLFASVGYAAPAPERAVPGRVCAPDAVRLQKLLRHPKSFGGPVANPSKRTLLGLKDVTALLKRGSRTNHLGDDDEAIQNDAPAAHIDDDQAAPALRPLGLFHGSPVSFLCTGTFSPRSPRGPPNPT